MLSEIHEIDYGARFLEHNKIFRIKFFKHKILCNKLSKIRVLEQTFQNVYNTF